MKKLSIFILALLIVFYPVLCFGASVTLDQATDITTDTTDFDGNLSAADNTVQEALDTLDDITGAAGDVTSAGDCASGACYDGSSDGGTYVRLYDGDSHYGAIVTANLSANRTYTLPNFDATLASLAGTETLTNKTLNSADNVIHADDAVNVVDADYGDISVSSGAWTVDANSVALGTDTTGNYALGDAEGGAATTGDSATAFFSAGSIELTRGGLGQDISGFSGVLGVSAGSGYSIVGTTTQILIFDGDAIPTVAALSGQATMTNGGVVTVNDVTCTNCLTTTEVASADLATNVSDADFGDVTVSSGAWAVEDESHAHTTTSISGIDIGDDTNLAADDALNLTGDELDIDLKTVGENGVGASSSASGMEIESDQLTLLQACGDGQILKWEEDTDTWDCADDGGAGATAWTDIGDASGDTVIALGAHETDFTSTIDASGEAVITITNTDADAANDNSLLDLKHNDGADANVFYVRFIGDADGTPTNDHLFSQASYTTTLPVSTPTLELSGTGTINGLDAIDSTGEDTLEAALDVAGDVDGTGLLANDLDEAAVETELEGVLDLDALQGQIADGQIADGAVDGGTGGEVADGSLTAADLGTDSVSDDELNATGVESELESALDIGGEVTSTGMASTVIADSITVTGWVMGASTATTPAENDNDTSLATTAYVQTEIASFGGGGTIQLPIYEAKLTGGFVVFTPTSGDATTQGAQLDASEGPWKLLFDATTDEGATWTFRLPDNWTAHSELKILYSMASGNANEVEFEAACMCVTPGDSADISTAGFAAVAVVADTVPGTAGYPDAVNITITDDSCAAGDIMWIYISTDSNDATNDDATGDREVRWVSYEYT